MAITTTTIYAAAGYARTDVINQIESAFNWLGFNAGPVSGMVTFQSGWTGGGTVSGDHLNAHVYNLPQKSSSGSGTGATWDVQRSGGSVYRVRPNRPGSGYAQGEQIVIDASHIGGTGAGAGDLTVTVGVDGAGSPNSYGSSTTMFHKENAVGTTYPYGITRHTVGAGKTYGDTYRAYKLTSDTKIMIRTGSSFTPYNATDYDSRGFYFSPGFKGDYGFDINVESYSGGGQISSTSDQDSSSNSKTITPQDFASSNTYPLQLNVYRSAIDTKFAVLSFREGTKPATTIEDNTYFTWFVHNYDSDLFDYDYLFQGGITQITSDKNSSYDELYWRSYYGETASTSTYGVANMRSAEFGYADMEFGANGEAGAYRAINYKETVYNGVVENGYNSSFNAARNVGTYNRDNSSHTGRGKNPYSNTSVNVKYMDTATNYNAVIKGIPLNALYAPCPYYIPDDFALIQFDYANPGANIQQGDTITISGSEVWTIIQGSYSQTNRTRGILFCARTT